MKRDGSIKFLSDAQVSENGYQYDLWCIDTETLYDLAMKSDSISASKVLSASVIQIRADAIMTTRQGTAQHGDIAEDGNGGIIISGTVYRLKDNSDLNRLKGIFSGHDFASYRNIQEELNNYQLTIKYNIRGTDAANEGSTSTAVVGNKSYSINSSGWLTSSGSVLSERYRVMEKVGLQKPAALSLSKTGYHLEAGKEWVTKTGYTFSSGAVYMPKDIEPGVGFKSMIVNLYANWKKNEYTIAYHANGGTGTVPSQKMYYDVKGNITNNSSVLRRTGYYLPEGEEWKDAYGNIYSNGEEVINLTSVHGATVTLYANWKPLIVSITADKQGGTGGTDIFYQKYGIGFFSDSTALYPISAVSIPSKTGYNFLGYFNNIYATGDPATSATGTIVIGNTFYTADSVIYADYEAKKFHITFDKQGGLGGTDKAEAVYDAVIPVADAPVKTGYSFKGYYTGKNGTGEKYYNEYMAPDMDSNPDNTYKLLTDLTLYAYWVDDSAPAVTLNVSIEGWTNRMITLTADAFDYGTGLKSVRIYRGSELVALADDLNGVVRKQITFDNTTEGAVTYKAVAVDVNGNEAECYAVVKYDITPPKGTITEETIDGDEISITLGAWDTKPDEEP